jgi:hypothetical protein
MDFDTEFKSLSDDAGIPVAKIAKRITHEVLEHVEKKLTIILQFSSCL